MSFNTRDVCSDWSTPIAPNLHIDFFMLNLINVIVGSLLLNFMIFVANGLTWLGWAERSKCVFALKYWYCVYASMSKSHFHRFGIGNVNIAISSRVIVIFVEYAFIYRCHYAVATLLFSVDIQCKRAFHHFSDVDSYVAETERKRKRLKSDLPTLSLPVIDGAIWNARNSMQPWDRCSAHTCA